MFVPVEFYAYRTHDAEGALNYETSLVYAMTEAPLYLMLVAHVVISVNAVLGRLEVFREGVEIIKFKFETQLFYVRIHGSVHLMFWSAALTFFRFNIQFISPEQIFI